MGWDEKQHYALTGTAVQVGAVVAVAEAFWSLPEPGGSTADDKRAVTFDGRYPSTQEAAAASSNEFEPPAHIVGLVFPWIHYGIHDRCPVSFAFMRNETSAPGAAAEWKLVTPRPLVDSQGRSFRPYDCYWRGARPGYDWPWVEAWGDDPVVRPGTNVVYRDGCDVVLRKVYPIDVALCLAAVRDLTGLSLVAQPDPRERISQFKDGDATLDHVLQALHLSPFAARQEHWQSVFEADAT